MKFKTVLVLCLSFLFSQVSPCLFRKLKKKVLGRKKHTIKNELPENYLVPYFKILDIQKYLTLSEALNYSQINRTIFKHCQKFVNIRKYQYMIHHGIQNRMVPKKTNWFKRVFYQHRSMPRVTPEDIGYLKQYIHSLTESEIGFMFLGSTNVDPLVFKLTWHQIDSWKKQVVTRENYQAVYDPVKHHLRVYWCIGGSQSVNHPFGQLEDSDDSENDIMTLEEKKETPRTIVSTFGRVKLPQLLIFTRPDDPEAVRYILPIGRCQFNTEFWDQKICFGVQRGGFGIKVMDAVLDMKVIFLEFSRIVVNYRASKTIDMEAWYEPSKDANPNMYVLGRLGDGWRKYKTYPSFYPTHIEFVYWDVEYIPTGPVHIIKQIE